MNDRSKIHNYKLRTFPAASEVAPPSIGGLGITRGHLQNLSVTKCSSDPPVPGPVSRMPCRPLSTPERSTPGRPGPVWAWAAALSLLFGAALWLERPAPPAGSPAPAAPAPSSASAARAVTSAPTAPTADSTPPAAPRSTSPQTLGSTAWAAAPAPVRDTLYLCRSYSGGEFWSNGHCHEQRALIVRMSRVPPQLPFEQQVHIAQSEARAAQSLVAPAPVQAARAPARDPAAECAYLDARIRALDAAARRPQSSASQDHLRTERAELRSRQWHLGC